MRLRLSDAPPFVMAYAGNRETQNLEGRIDISSVTPDEIVLRFVGPTKQLRLSGRYSIAFRLL